MPEIEGEVTVKDKKVRAVFVGEDITVAELIKRGPTPIQFMEPRIPEATSSYGRVHAQRTPRLLIAWGVENCAYPNFATVVVTSHKTNKLLRLILPLDYKIHVLTGRQGKVMSEAYAAYLEDNFLASFTRPPMSLGADPEFFIEDDNRVIPAFEFLPSKKAAKPTTISYGETHVYWDGFQAEFDMPSRTCIMEFSGVMQNCMGVLLAAARKKFKGARLSTKTVVQIPQEVLDAAAPEHVEFGCAPSLNAYGLAGGSGGLDGRSTPLRFAGGHIHFGVDGLPKERLVSAVKALDTILAVACVPLFADFDNPLRRKFYGLPGEYRLPKHGLEYRTLSNAWLCHPLIYNLVLEVARLSFCVGTSGLLSAWKYNEGEVIDIVRGCNVAGAREFMERNRAKFVRLLTRVPAFVDYRNGYVGAYDMENLAYPERIYRIFMEGVASVVTKPDDIEGNWRLTRGDWGSYGEGYNWTNSRGALMEGRKV